MSVQTLVAVDRPSAPLFLRPQGGVTREQFLATALAFADRLDGAGPLLNLCAQRDRFALTLVAAALRGRHCLLPPSAAPETVRALAADHDGALAVCDSAESSAGLDWLAPPDFVAAASAPPVLTVPDSQLAVVAFTSGSTGRPQPHAKTWATLAATARHLSARLLDGIDGAHLVATVPPQHMFGLETTVLLPLLGDAAIDPGRPFFPADVAAALASVPAPRVLVTTPVHLRALVASRVALPPLAAVISATAPLPLALAQQVEDRFAAPVHEIYGCTETGAIASRRSVDGERWLPFAGVRVDERGDTAVVSAAHLPDAVALQDIVSVEADGFRLLGRSADLIKVAGKRISAAELTQQILAIPGVDDAVVLAPDADDVAGRPAALVVAPNLSEASILDALASHVDPVFLPRPLRRVAVLPRNAVGKLPRERLLELLRG